MKNLETNLIPVIIQHSENKDVLMLGYMNNEALKKTIKSKKVWSYSRSKKRLWEKGESSGNYLKLINIMKNNPPVRTWRTPYFARLVPGTSPAIC